MTRRSMKDLMGQFGLLVSRMATTAINRDDESEGLYLDQSSPERGYRVMVKYRDRNNKGQWTQHSVFGDYCSVTQLFDRIENGILAMNAYRLVVESRTLQPVQGKPT